MDKIRIIEASNELSLGGTEYVIQLFSKFLNKEYFDVTVVALYKGGERVKLIQDLGIEVIVLNGDLNKFWQLLQETDVFHWHSTGELDPKIFNIVREVKPKLVIQTNVFGLYTHPELYDIIDYDLYVSKMILVRRMFNDKHLPDNFASKRRVLPNPVDVDYINSLLPSDLVVQRFKEENNLKDCFVVGRIGRADDTKFDLITLDGFAEFAGRVDNARFLLVGATSKMLAHAKALNIIDRLIVLENTPDLGTLLVYYKAMDVFLAASQIGESFGMVIAEAMTVGVPVVTVSTPEWDNAQIEIVDNNKTGLVVEHDVEKIASALTFLYQNEKTRVSMSVSSKKYIIDAYEASNVVGSLEGLIFSCLNIKLQNKKESLILEYSEELFNNYARRCFDLGVDR